MEVLCTIGSRSSSNFDTSFQVISLAYYPVTDYFFVLMLVLLPRVFKWLLCEILRLLVILFCLAVVLCLQLRYSEVFPVND